MPFYGGRVRRDLKMAVDFFTTRVKDPDKDDWVNLKRVMKYIKGTLVFNLTLKADILSVIKWWIDALFDTHNDCWGHTGGMMYLGEGAITSGS